MSVNQEKLVGAAEKEIQRICLDLEAATGRRVQLVRVDTRNFASCRTEIFFAPIFPIFNLTEADIGRKVVYTGNRYPGGNLEEGVITSFNDHTVFVRYGSGQGSKATNREDLEWLL